MSSPSSNSLHLLLHGKNHVWSRSGIPSRHTHTNIFRVILGMGLWQFSLLLSPVECYNFCPISLGLILSLFVSLTSLHRVLISVVSWTCFLIVPALFSVAYVRTCRIMAIHVRTLLSRVDTYFYIFNLHTFDSLIIVNVFVCAPGCLQFEAITFRVKRKGVY